MRELIYAFGEQLMESDMVADIHYPIGAEIPTMFEIVLTNGERYDISLTKKFN